MSNRDTNQPKPRPTPVYADPKSDPELVWVPQLGAWGWAKDWPDLVQKRIIQ